MSWQQTATRLDIAPYAVRGEAHDWYTPTHEAERFDPYEYIVLYVVGDNVARMVMELHGIPYDFEISFRDRSILAREDRTWNTLLKRAICVAGKIVRARVQLIERERDAPPPIDIDAFVDNIVALMPLLGQTDIVIGEADYTGPDPVEPDWPRLGLLGVQRPGAKEADAVNQFTDTDALAGLLGELRINEDPPPAETWWKGLVGSVTAHKGVSRRLENLTDVRSKYLAVHAATALAFVAVDKLYEDRNDFPNVWKTLALCLSSGSAILGNLRFASHRPVVRFEAALMAELYAQASMDAALPPARMETLQLRRDATLLQEHLAGAVFDMHTQNEDEYELAYAEQGIGTRHVDDWLDIVERRGVRNKAAENDYRRVRDLWDAGYKVVRSGRAHPSLWYPFMCALEHLYPGLCRAVVPEAPGRANLRLGALRDTERRGGLVDTEHYEVQLLDAAAVVRLVADPAWSHSAYPPFHAREITLLAVSVDGAPHVRNAPLAFGSAVRLLTVRASGGDREAVEPRTVSLALRVSQPGAYAEFTKIIAVETYRGAALSVEY